MAKADRLKPVQWPPVAAAQTAHEKTIIQRQIDAGDRQIDRLVYAQWDWSPRREARFHNALLAAQWHPGGAVVYCWFRPSAAG